MADVQFTMKLLTYGIDHCSASVKGAQNFHWLVWKTWWFILSLALSGKRIHKQTCFLVFFFFSFFTCFSFSCFSSSPLLILIVLRSSPFVLLDYTYSSSSSSSSRPFFFISLPNTIFCWSLLKYITLFSLYLLYFHTTHTPTFINVFSLCPSFPISFSVSFLIFLSRSAQGNESDFTDFLQISPNIFKPQFYVYYEFVSLALNVWLKS